jgi:hypothetical protein
LLNHIRVSRGKWRLKAFIDPIGRPANDAFLPIRPTQSGWTVPMLWALCNSPIANAYTYSHSAKKHIVTGFLQNMRVPDISQQDTSNLEQAIEIYLTAAADFSSIQMKPQRKRKSDRTNKDRDTVSLPLFEEAQIKGDPPVDSDRTKLRALLWRIDAEILRLYSLPATLERQLLDFFDGVERVGVPFHQERYIPNELTYVNRLDDYLQISDEWDRTDERRCELIEKRIKCGKRTPEEQKEFDKLQHLFDLRRQYCSPGPLIDESMLGRLLEEDLKSK